MKIKRYRARDMREALRRIREEQGADAVILSTRKTEQGLEVISAVDFDQTLIDLAFAQGPGNGQSPGGPAESNGRADKTEPTGRNPELDPTRKTGRGPVNFMQRLGRRHSKLSGADASDSHENSGQREEVSETAPKPDRVTLSETARNAGEQTLTGLQSETSQRRVDPTPGDEAMRREINALRRMLESQLSALAWHDFARASPARGALLKDLIQLGLSREQSRKLVAEISTRKDDLSHGWAQALGLIAQRIAICESDPVDRGGVIALVGPTGAGKTTTIAKLAARHAMLHGPEQVAMVTADDFRIGAQEQLFAWGRMLNIPVFSAASHDELLRRIERLEQNRSRGNHLVLVDTAGVGRDNLMLSRVREMVSGIGRGMRSLLVLPANAQRCALLESARNFRRCELAGLVLTKLDEAASLGGVLGMLLETGWPLAFSCDGQEVPENLRRASARNLVRRAADLIAEEESGDPDHAGFSIASESYSEYAFG